eukprot:2500948-Rhodomonas_salina.2
MLCMNDTTNSGCPKRGLLWFTAATINLGLMTLRGCAPSSRPKLGVEENERVVVQVDSGEIEGNMETAAHEGGAYDLFETELLSTTVAVTGEAS